MFTTFVILVHVTVCVALILIILIQSGKGADIGAAFGGGSSQTVFGSTGAAPFLSKVTIIAAVMFMVTSIFLSYFSEKGATTQERSLMSGQAVQESTPQVPAPGAPEAGEAEKGQPAGTPVSGSGASESTAPSVPAAPGGSDGPASKETGPPPEAK